MEKKNTVVLSAPWVPGSVFFCRIKSDPSIQNQDKTSCLSLAARRITTWYLLPWLLQLTPPYLILAPHLLTLNCRGVPLLMFTYASLTTAGCYGNPFKLGSTRVQLSIKDSVAHTMRGCHLGDSMGGFQKRACHAISTSATFLSRFPPTPSEKVVSWAPCGRKHSRWFF